MSILLISISYRHAPLSIREKFGFDQEQRETIRKNLIKTKEIAECVLIATCNRTELYCYSKEGVEDSRAFSVMQEHLLHAAGCDNASGISSCLRFFQEKKAISHLFLVAAGLDSMVIGEDQILGQTRDAFEEAKVCKTTGIYLNTLFRYAITSAKKVKTDTNLSKMPVSTATIAIKAAQMAFGGDLAGKKLMIIGASGKIGNILLKNLQDVNGVKIYATTHRRKIAGDGLIFTQIPYQERYRYADDMDVIISATSSPHYTITTHDYHEAVKTKKKRVLIDLAVPLDIEQSVANEDDIIYHNIDDFAKISKENNEKKQEEAILADKIIEEYEKKFNQWLIFKNHEETMNHVVDFLVTQSQQKGVEYAARKLFYQLRDHVEPEILETMFQGFEEQNEKNSNWNEKK